MKEELIELLYRSLDSQLDPEEQRRLADALASMPSLQAEKKRIERIRSATAASAEDSFEFGFADRVMNRIAAVEAEETGTDPFDLSIMQVFRKVVVAGIAAALILVAANMYRNGGVSLNAALGIPSDSLEQIADSPLNAFLEDFS